MTVMQHFVLFCVGDFISIQTWSKRESIHVAYAMCDILQKKHVSIFVTVHHVLVFLEFTVDF